MGEIRITTTECKVAKRLKKYNLAWYLPIR
jgi:hypothetical protein